MKKTKIYFGKKAKETRWGRSGSSRGMYTGGFERYMYGIKGLFLILTIKAWGSWERDLDSFFTKYGGGE